MITLPTILEVAKLANVSKSTVSRVVAGQGSVSEKSRKKVEEAIKELGYRPNQFAQGLKSNRSNLIGVVVVDIGSPYYCQMLGGIQEIIHQQGKEMMVVSGFGDRDKEYKAIQSLLDRRCDGLILYLESDIRSSELAQLNVSDAKIMMIGGGVALKDHHRVQVQNRTGGFMAADYLIKQGHRRIVHLAGHQHYADARDRLAGFQDAIEMAGLPLDDSLIRYGDYSEEFGYQATLALVKDGIEFTALCAGDDDMAAGAYQALKELGKKIPEQVSVIGYDDNFHARYMDPGLTTIRQPITKLGELAATQLLALINKEEKVDQRVDLEPELIVRGSVASLEGGL